MTKLILSTSNIMGHGPPLIRRPSATAERSNTELTTSLRKNFIAAQHDYDHRANGVSQTNGTSHPHDHSIRPHFSAWTSRQGNCLYIPSMEFGRASLAEERSQYEITVKLFYLPNNPASCRCAQTKEAIKCVLKELGVPNIDLLIVTFPGVTFDADDEEEDEDEVEYATTGENTTASDPKAEDVDTMLATWRCLEELCDEGVIARLGVAEFGTEKLAKFLPKARIRPSVDQINVRDCCVVPKPLILYARQEKIELLTHNDCTNILSRGTLRDLLGQSNHGAGVLVDGKTSEKGLGGDVEPQWVIKYTAVVKNRGVIENKGYFAVAELHD